MKLGLFLAIGESFADFDKKGQFDLIKNYLIKNYSQNFDQVNIFSYGNEQLKLFTNVDVLPNKWNVNRFLYSILLHFFYIKQIRSCDVLRGLQLTGGIPCILGKLFFNKPFVINYGYNYVKFARIEGKYLQSVLFRLIKYPILLLTDKIIITAKYLKTEISNIIPKNKIVVIPNGVDTKLFKPIKTKKTIDLLYVGRLEKQKNLSNLIKAISLLPQLNLSLTLVGDGSLKKLLIQTARNYQVKLTIKPPISHHQLPYVLNKARIFILPSVIEGQPKILLEALSCGIPIVASNIMAHQEIIIDGKNGILRGISADELADGIAKLLRNPNLRAKLTINARQTAIKKI